VKNLTAWACFALTFSAPALCQVDLPTFKAEVRSTFIWGEDAPAGATSSAMKDPLTGNEILKLKHNGVEVSSRMGFEKLRPEDVAEFIAYSTTIINNTETELAVERGGITVDGYLVTPLSVDANIKGVKKKPSKEGMDALRMRDLHCFKSGTLPGEKSLLVELPSSAVIVEPRSSRTVSGVIKDPRHYPILCSVDGCFPKGTIRYSIRAGGHEYIFTWQGRSVANCSR